jgi:hypothetical protein
MSWITNVVCALVGFVTGMMIMAGLVWFLLRKDLDK